MFDTLIKDNTPVTKPKEQHLANEILENFFHIFFGELIISPSKLRNQKHQNLHLYYTLKQCDKPG